MEMIPNVVYCFIIVFANFTDIVGSGQGKGRQGERGREKGERGGRRREGRDKGEKRREKGERGRDKGERKKGERREVKGKRREGKGERREGEGDGRKVPPVRPLISDVNFLLLRLNLCLGICVLWTHSFLTLYHILQLTS